MPAWIDLAAVFPPLLAAAIVGLFTRKIGDRAAQVITCAAVLFSAICSVLIFKDVALAGHARTIHLMDWISSGDFKAGWDLRIDTLTAVMLVVVNGVSSMVHIYSVGYMSHDKSVPRFMAYLSLFTFFMLMLVTADNFLQMFFGWEGVGLASYLLINFWYEKDSANRAAMKAFIVNRVGDFGFALGIMLCFALYNSIQFDAVFTAAGEAVPGIFHLFGHEITSLEAVCLLLFIGAMGKSAQLGLHTWLPDAMEGPTPVSALIHAATMVTAGVFMVARLSPLFELAPLARDVVCLTGALTAIVAATIGMTQFDIKRVIAYSTMSQLGYMFFALGVSAYSAAIFHLMTHAFFKALLFLGAGSVIHAMSGEQDMRKMGGIWKKIPMTYALMWIGSLALAGIGFEHVFGFAGFYSKDAILESAWAAGRFTGSKFGHLAYWLGIVTAFLTAFYSWRLLLLTFHGRPRADHHTMEHVHESPLVMLLPLLPLAIGSVVAGYFGYHWFVGEGQGEFWGKALLVLPEHNAEEIMHESGKHVPHIVTLLPLLAALSGIGLAYVAYLAAPGLPAKFARAMGGLYRLVFNKYYIDELYDFLFVRTARRYGEALWRWGDDKVIDGFGPNGIAALAQRLAARASAMQTGYVYHYAFAMVIGVAAFMSWFWGRG
ncbi:MAG: NADH-quinone oxidoreductase subunit L [Alphaproteobacteria bacterium]